MPAGALTIDGVEYFGGVGYLKAGLLLSDRITTVSPTYAREIMTPEFGMALDGLLRTRAAVVQGIVNGIDDTVWNPATDAALAQNYSALRIDMRVRNKTALQTRMGLAPGVNRPLFGVVSRLSDQKGLDLLLEALPGLIAKGGQLALLGSGDRALEAGFTAAAAARPDSVGCVIGYDEKLAHLIQAGADFIVVPSRFEPCGLTQLCALRYGAVPIVARVGGLADTVIDANEAATAAGVATGVQFYPPSVEALTYALDRALEIGRDPAMSRAPQAQRHALGRLLARSGAAVRRALSRSRQARRMSELPAGLGVVVSASGLEAALVLPNAESASLCLYDGDREVFRAPMARDADGVLRGLAPGFGAGARYGFRVEGPYDPARGARFDASKLLADPYAWRFDRPFRLHPSMFAFGDDSGPFTPKAIAGAPPAGEPGLKRIAPEALVIYELNLRGFSRLNPAIPEAPRGTFAGLAHPASIAHLAALGVTAVEIMPADAFVDERHLPPLGLVERLGLQRRRVRRARSASCARRLGGGARGDRRAARGGHGGDPRRRLQPQRRERPVRADAVVPRPRQRGLVPPRSARSGALHQRCRHRQLPRARPPAGHRHGDRRAQALDGPRRLRRLSLRSRDDARPPRGRLRPEGAVLRGARRRSGPRQGAPHRRAVGRRPGRLPARPVRPRVRRMERPLSRRRAPLLARRRRAARRDRDPDRGLARRVRSTPRRRPKGVNFVVAHDGFTLRDLVSYEHKHNEANGENNRDGTDNNLSWNHGVEGPSDDPAISSGAFARRAQSADAAARLARDADARHGHRSSASARAATTTPTPRTTRRARSTGAPPTLR